MNNTQKRTRYKEPPVKRHFDLPPDVNKALKKKANEENKSDVAIVQEAIAAYSQPREVEPLPPVSVRTAVREEMRESIADILREAGLTPLGRAVASTRTPVRVKLWETMAVPCGEAQTLDEVFEALGEPQETEIEGRLAELATPHSWIARANGWSMSSDDDLGGISHNDRVLLTPFNEYNGHLESGMVVLARLKYKNGATKCTLKTYCGKKLRAKNPRFKGVDFNDGKIESATVWAICRGVVERVFG